LLGEKEEKGELPDAVLLEEKKDDPDDDGEDEVPEPNGDLTESPNDPKNELLFPEDVLAVLEPNKDEPLLPLGDDEPNKDEPLLPLVEDDPKGLEFKKLIYIYITKEKVKIISFIFIKL
jgi:hypothetical protein